MGGLAIAIAAWTSAHVLIHRRDPRAALWWMAMVWFLPFVGAALYYLLGINRIQRRLASFARRRRHLFKAFMPAHIFSRREDHSSISPNMRHLFLMSRIGEHVTERPLLYGNKITALRNGEAAFPAMLNAIESAQRSVSLSTYIFKYDDIGHKFIQALQRAKERGVEVRIMVDDLGSGFPFSKVGRLLQQAGIQVASFIPAMTVANLPYLNLRNHRKLLIIDGETGFSGGMNIQDGQQMHDLHFQIEGPVVAQLQEAFAEDWLFCTKEELKGLTWFPKLSPKGKAYCRGVADGPDENLETLRWILLGAINSAQTSITIMSPYFIPDSTLMNALCVASLRGVKVHVILPSENDWPLVSWASTSYIRQIMERGCRVWMTPPPFDHSKLMVVDGGWTLLGSSNWDTRSLRLNFEFNVECYDEELALSLMEDIQNRMKTGQELTLQQVESRPLPIKLRDGVARLFAPHL